MGGISNLAYKVPAYITEEEMSSVTCCFLVSDML